MLDQDQQDIQTVIQRLSDYDYRWQLDNQRIYHLMQTSLLVKEAVITLANLQAWPILLNGTDAEPFPCGITKLSLGKELRKALKQQPMEGYPYSSYEALLLYVVLNGDFPATDLPLQNLNVNLQARLMKQDLCIFLKIDRQSYSQEYDWNILRRLVPALSVIGVKCLCDLHEARLLNPLSGLYRIGNYYYRSVQSLINYWYEMGQFSIPSNLRRALDAIRKHRDQALIDQMVESSLVKNVALLDLEGKSVHSKLGKFTLYIPKTNVELSKGSLDTNWCTKHPQPQQYYANYAWLLDEDNKPVFQAATDPNGSTFHLMDRKDEPCTNLRLKNLLQVMYLNHGVTKQVQTCADTGHQTWTHVFINQEESKATVSFITHQYKILFTGLEYKLIFDRFQYQYIFKQGKRGFNVYLRLTMPSGKIYFRNISTSTGRYVYHGKEPLKTPSFPILSFTGQQFKPLLDFLEERLHSQAQKEAFQACGFWRENLFSAVAYPCLLNYAEEIHAIAIKSKIFTQPFLRRVSAKLRDLSMQGKLLSLTEYQQLISN